MARSHYHDWMQFYMQIKLFPLSPKKKIRLRKSSSLHHSQANDYSRREEQKKKILPLLQLNERGPPWALSDLRSAAADGMDYGASEHGTGTERQGNMGDDSRQQCEQTRTKGVVLWMGEQARQGNQGLKASSRRRHRCQTRRICLCWRPS